jgi:hypothetical protein
MLQCSCKDAQARPLASLQRDLTSPAQLLLGQDLQLKSVLIDDFTTKTSYAAAGLRTDGRTLWGPCAE